MKIKPPSLTHLYQEALCGYVQDGADLKTAQDLGRLALKQGLETLELARLHEEAVLSLSMPPATQAAKKHSILQCRAFFAEAMTPIENNRPDARAAREHLKVMVETLTLRTQELAASNDELKHEIQQQRTVEDSLRHRELSTRDMLKTSQHVQEELRLLARRLLSAQKLERLHISRKLHEVVAQSLSGIQTRLAALKLKTASQAKNCHQKIATSQRLIVKSVDIVHRFAADLRPAVLDDLGLIPALEGLVQKFTDDTGIQVTLTAMLEVAELSSSERTVLYRVVQEALANVAQHARGSRVKVSLHEVKDGITLEVQDTGRGFDVDAADYRQRLGLLGMKERVEMIGGRFGVKSKPGKGTTLHADIKRAGNLPQKRPPQSPADTPFQFS
jgi:signal transduction histidine kinase